MRMLFFMCGLLTALITVTATARQSAPSTSTPSGSVLAAPPLSAPQVEVFVDGMMREAMEGRNVSGATVAIVQGDQILLSKGYGTARLTPVPRATDANTLFQIASVSKTPVYLAAMQLVEAGKITLDDPVNSHLPVALRIPDEGFKNPVLVRHLMSHSAGFEDSSLGHLFANQLERLMPTEAYLAKYQPHRVREPGTRIAYSNVSLLLLGEIVVQKSGLDWPTYAEQKILRPLGMTMSTYREPYSAELQKRLKLPLPMPADVAANITQQLDGGPGNWKERGPEYTTPVAAAGGMRASANDMAQYLLALTSPERLEKSGVLKASTFRQMMQPAINLPNAASHGFIHYDMTGGRKAFGHGGAMVYGASDLVILPERALGIFISTNGTGGFEFANDFARRFIAHQFPQADPAPVRTAETKALAGQLAGDWISNRRAYFRTERAFTALDSAVNISAKEDGDIIITPFMGAAARHYPMGDGVWRHAKRYTTIKAVKNADGTITLWSGFGISTTERATLFERPLITLGILILGLICAARLSLRTIASLFQREKQASAAKKSAIWLFAAALIWTVGLGGLVSVLAGAAADGGAQLTFDYPGPVRIFAWVLAAAAVLTLAAWWFFLRNSKATGWSGWRKTRHAFVLLLFSAVSVVCWKLGLLGFSGF
jgi:CubicO group peptidase (beta-lactamase class C family)